MNLGFLRITIIYVLVGLLWITFSDKILFLFHHQLNATTLLILSSSKGYLFVLVTGLLINNLVNRAKKQLSDSEKQYRTMYEGNPLPMWIYNMDTLNFVSVNEAAIEKYGYTREAFLAMSILDIRPHGSKQEVLESVRNVSKNFKQSGKWIHQKADGSLIHVTISSQRILFNKTPHVLVIAQDITEKVLFEQRLEKLNADLKKEKQKLSETQQTAKVARWELFLQNNELVWSDELYWITGIQPDPSRNLFDMYVEHIHPEDRPHMIAWLEMIVTSGKQHDITHRITYPNTDATRYVRHIARPEFVGGKPYKVIGSMQDITEFKLMELEKNKYLYSFEDTLESMSESFYALNAEFVITKANKKFELETGMNNADTIGRKLTDVFPGIENRQTYTELKRAIKERTPIDFETYSQNLNQWLRVSAYPTEEGLAVYFSNITEQKEKDLKLKEAIERYEKVLKATQDIIYDYDLLQDRLYYNNTETQIMNYTAEELGRNFQWWQSIIHIEDQKKFIQSQQKAIEQKKTNWSCEYRIDCGRGQYKHVYDQGYIIYNSYNEPIRIIGAIRDIDALKQANEENRRLAEIITKVNNMIIVMDTESRITWANKAFQDYCGYAIEDILGKQPREFLVGPDTSIETLNYITQCKRRKESFSAELIHYIRNQQQWVSIEYTPLFNDSHQHIGYIAVHQNITTRKEKLERIKKQNQILQEIAWLSSHEIRRPVASIIGLVGLVDPAELTQDTNEIVHMINTCAIELDGIVHHITKRVDEEINAA